MARSIQAPRGARADQLRQDLAGFPGVTVGEPDASGIFTVTVPEGVDGVAVLYVVRRSAVRSLIMGVRQAKPGTVELRDAVAAALEALAG